MFSNKKISLRSRTIGVKTPQTKQYKNENKVKSTKNISKMCSEIEDTVNLIDLTSSPIDITSSQNDHILSEIKLLKSIIVEQKLMYDKSINELREEMREKADKYEYSMKYLATQIEQMNMGQTPTNALSNTQSNALQKPSKHIKSIEKSIIHNSSIAQIEYAYSIQLEEINKRINTIEKNIFLIEELLIDSQIEITSKQSSVNEERLVDSDHLDTIQNQIICIEEKMHRMELSANKDSETLLKMNEQLHILSSKFINFNAKMHEHVNVCNDIHNNSRQKLKSIIDKDTIPFIVQNNDRKNRIASKKRVTGCFVNKYDKYEYTRNLTIRIRDANIIDMQKLNGEFTEIFETILGKNIIESVTEIDEITDNGINNQFEIRVLLQIPLNYEYIDRFKFPLNWDFLAVDNKINHEK